MTFAQADVEMDKGKNVRLPTWPDGQYAYKTPVVVQGGQIQYRMCSANEPQGTWEPTDADKEASGWVVVT